MTVVHIEPERPDIEAVIGTPPDAIADNTVVEGVRFGGLPSTPITARGVAISGSKIAESAFTGSKLPAVQFVDCVFERANLSEASWVDARIVRARFEGCKLTGFDAHGGEFRDVVFSECKMPDAFLVESTLTRARFDGCKLNGLDLCGSKINSVAIHGCDARNLRLMGTKIDLLDLRGSLIEGIALEPGSVGHLVIDPTQGSAIASAMGARVLDISDQ